MTLVRAFTFVAILVALCGFTDGYGHYTLAIPSGWSATLSNADLTIYSPSGDARRAALAIRRDGTERTPRTLFDVLPTFSPNHIELTEKISVAGRDCLHAIGRALTGKPVLEHILVCDLVRTPYPGTRENFVLSVAAIQGNNYGIDPGQIFWSVIQTIQWAN